MFILYRNQANHILEKYSDRKPEEGIVSRGWIPGYLSRHPLLKREKSEIIDAIRREACTKQNLQPFYERFHSLVEKYGITNELIFNLDETSINFTQKYRGRVITTTTMSPPITAQPDRSTSSTLVLCIPASGKALDATLLWPQKTVPAEFSTFPVKDIRVQCESSSWQTRASFERMMMEYYLPEMCHRRDTLQQTEKPILLLLDGHSSRISITVIEECVAKNVILLILPAHTSNITQPLDCDPN